MLSLRFQFLQPATVIPMEPMVYHVTKRLGSVNANSPLRDRCARNAKKTITTIPYVKVCLHLGYYNGALSGHQCAILSFCAQNATATLRVPRKWLVILWEAVELLMMAVCASVRTESLDESVIPA